MSFRLLKDAVAWEVFKSSFAATHELVLEEVTWGTGPPAFPCLVTALPFATKKRVLCCFVTPDDARQLLAACIEQASPDQAAPDPDTVRLERDLAAELDTLKEILKLKMEQDRQYAIANSAHLRVHLTRGFQTGFYKSQEDYAEAYAKSLAYFDQLAAEQARDLSIQSFKLET